MVRTALSEFAKEVRRHDPERIITSGNSSPRPSAWHQRTEGTWTEDSDAQYATMLAGDNPSPMNVLSIHVYGDSSQLATSVEVALGLGKPLFVGEFGVPGAPSEESKAAFASLLGQIEELNVALAALWVYDFGSQDGEWNVTAENERAYQLEAIAEANARMRGE